MKLPSVQKITSAIGGLVLVLMSVSQLMDSVKDTITKAFDVRDTAGFTGPPPPPPVDSTAISLQAQIDALRQYHE